MKEIFILLFIYAIFNSTLAYTSSIQTVPAILVLGFCFLLNALMLIAMDLQFIGLSFVVIYLRAIIILFLFAIMLLHIKENDKKFYKQIQKTHKFFLFFSILYILSFIFYFYIQKSNNLYFINEITKINSPLIKLTNCCFKIESLCDIKTVDQLSNSFMQQLVNFNDKINVYNIKNNKFFFYQFDKNFKNNLKFITDSNLQNLFINLPKGNPNIMLRDRTELEVISKTLYNDGCFHIIFVSIILLISLLGSVSLITDVKKKMESQLTINQGSRKLIFNFSKKN